MRKFYQEAIIKDECVTLRQLAVSGRDLIESWHETRRRDRKDVKRAFGVCDR